MSVTSRHGAPSRASSGAPLPLVAAGAAAGAAAGGVSFLALGLVALAAWLLDPSAQQDWTQMLAVAAGAWLAGLGLAPTVGSVAITLLPWGFGLLSATALVVSTRWAVVASAVGRRGEAVMVAVAAGGAFAACAAVIALLGRTIEVNPLRAAVTCGVLATVIALVAAWQRAGVLRASAVPAHLRNVIAASAAALCTLAALGAVAMLVAIVLHVNDITALLVEIDAGLAGTLLLAVLSLGYLPVALTWSMAYLLGPGVSVANDTVVGPFSSAADASLPGFPLLAALPGQAPTGSILLPLAGVAAGVMGGAILRRRGLVGVPAIPQGLVAALIAAGVLALLCWLSSGSVGTRSLIGLGPAVIPVALAAFLTMGLGATAALCWPRRTADV